jgi:hypothetical protein
VVGINNDEVFEVKVSLFQLLCIIWRTVLLVFNDTFNNVLVITYNMVTSFISV